MDTNRAQPITVHLPPEILRQVRSAAKRRRVTPDAVIAETLGSLLPAETDVSTRDVRSRVQRMLRESKDELMRKSARQLPEHASARLSELLAANGERKLSQAEERELDNLIDESERIAFDSLAARWALKSLDSSDGRDA
jgi:Arc/MetJ-type ribon-helix-helix transcriptional regulator